MSQAIRPKLKKPVNRSSRESVDAELKNFILNERRGGYGGLEFIKLSGKSRAVFQCDFYGETRKAFPHLYRNMQSDRRRQSAEKIR